MASASSRKHSSLSAFTLVELLVVIAIIAVLAGLLLPALASAQAKSRSAQCLGNLRQWGLAFHMYADDHNDFLPRRGQGVQPLFQIDRSDDWFNALPPYLGSPSFEVLVTRSNASASIRREWSRISIRCSGRPTGRSVATNVLDSGGAFSVTVTNAASADASALQFFILRTH